MSISSNPTFKKKFLFFIFRYKFRVLALNNFLRSKKIGNYHLINLSGPFLSFLGKFYL